MTMQTNTSLDYTTEHLNRNSIEWENRKALYGEKKPYCKKHFLVNDKEKNISKARCNSVKCKECRPRQKKRLLDKIARAGSHNKLLRHMVITVLGNEFRDKVSPDNSFSYAQEKWNHLRLLYKRNFGRNLSFVSLPRSQRDGYCHLHVLVGSYIPKKWLDWSCKKVGLGYAYIRYTDVQRLKGYLSKYWYKEHEWYIPENKKQYTCSRDIVLSDYEGFVPSDKWEFFEAVYYNGIIGCLEDVYCDRPPPVFDFGFYETLPHFETINSVYLKEWKTSSRLFHEKGIIVVM